MLSSGTTLVKSHAALRSPITIYSTDPDQGVEYGDSVTQSGQSQINLAFDLWSGADDVRVITLAP